MRSSSRSSGLAATSRSRPRNDALARGSVSVNVAPRPGADATASVPPWASAIERAM